MRLPRNPIRVKGYRRARRVRPSRARTARKPLMKLMKSVATKVQNAGLETKYVCDTFNNIQFNSGVTSGSEQYSCYPLLGPGTGTFQRVGLNVSPIRCKNTWVISLNTVSRSLNLYVDLFVMIDKNNRYYPNVVSSGAPRFLRTGNSSGETQLYNGFNTDGMKQISSQRYTLLKHFRFQLANNVGVPNGDTTAGNSPNVAGQSARTISFVVDTPKQLKYQPLTTTPDYPNGHAPFWCLGYSKVDGSSPDVANQSITVSHITELIYKDA